MINGGGLNFRKSGVLALTQSQSSPSLPGIYFTSRQCSTVCHCVCVCEESFPNFRSFRTSCRLLHVLLTSPSKACFSTQKLFCRVQKNSSVPLAEMDGSFSICSHYSFSLFIASGLQNEKRQHLNFFVRSYFENICGPQLSLGLLLAHVGQNNCDKTD